MLTDTAVQTAWLNWSGWLAKLLRGECCVKGGEVSILAGEAPYSAATGVALCDQPQPKFYWLAD